MCIFGVFYSIHYNQLIMLSDLNIPAMSFVHDSYGTHACHVSDLHRIIREAFVMQYEDGLMLRKFHKKLQDDLRNAGKEEFIELLPEVPKLGDLDIKEVLGSTYFFQ